ncbi:MAG: helix-turn-helix transcriptional regulator [Chitinophagaceae bacterium]|nr:helix-turn-helix transcriptional regulator [Chitinophagaceae bacterium]
MGRQKSLKITYTNDEKWLPKLALQLKADYTDHTAHFDNEIGKGSFYKVDIDWGLQVRKFEATFHQPVIFGQKMETPSPKGYYVLLSNLSERYIETSSGENTCKLGYSSHNGIYFSSPFLSATFLFEPNVSYLLIFIIISHDRVRNFIARQQEPKLRFLENIINSNKSIYHAEALDAGLIAALKDIDKNLNDERPNNLLLHSKILDLCYRMLQKVDQRNNKQPAGKIHAEDVKKLNEIRRDLLDHYQEACPPIADIARKTAMSPTKFKKLFKQMFGYSYYQFYKNVRMYKARELLEQRKMNASEVAHLLGYNNLSKFSKAFKDVFSVTPGKIAGD